MSKNKVIHHSLFDVDVTQAFDDGYINITALSNAYFAQTGKKRTPGHWLSLKRTKEMMEHLSGSIGFPIDKLYRTVTTGPNDQRGTYLHPRLSVRFAIWLSDEFGFAVEQFIAEWGTEFQNFVNFRADGKGMRHEAMRALQQSGFGDRHHYINATQVVYRSLFGKSAKDLKAERGIPEDGNLRDGLTTHELRMVKCFEEMLVQELEHGNHENFSSFYAAAKTMGTQLKAISPALRSL